MTAGSNVGIDRADMTVVLFPETEEGKQFVHTASEWTITGAIAPALWVPVTAIDPPEAVPSLAALHVDEHGEREVDLLSFLGQHVVALVRVIAVAPIGLDDWVGSTFLDQAADVADTVTAAFPSYVANNAATAGTRVARLLLLVPASGAEGKVPESSVARWPRVLVAAPESRRSPQHSNQYVRDGLDLAEHATTAAAAVGALWTDSGVGPFDDPGGASSVPDTVRVIRPFVRVILADRSAGQVADEIVEELDHRPSLPVGQADGVEASSRVRALLNAMRDYLLTLEDGALSLRNAPENPLPPRQQVGFGKALHDWLAFAGAALVLPWKVLIQFFRRKVEAVATTVVYGSDGDREIRFRPVDPESLADDVNDELDHQTNAALFRIENEDAEAVVRPLPRIWQAFRDAAFGLIDGRQPEGFPALRAGTAVEVVPDRTFVAPAPRENFEVNESLATLLALPSDSRALTRFDEYATYRHRTQVRVSLDLLVTSLIDREDKSAEADFDRSAAEKRLRRKTDAPTALTEEELRMLRDGLLPEDDEALADVSWVEKGTLEDARTFAKELMALDAWLSRGNSFVDHIVAGVGTSRSEAMRRFRQVLRAIAPNRVDTETIARARRRFLRRYWLGLAALASTIAAWWWLDAQRQLDQIPLTVGPIETTLSTGQVASGIVTALLLLLGGFVLAYGRAHSTFIRHVQRIMRRQDELAEQAIEAKREWRRLESIDAQLGDWAEIVSWIIHEPWGRADHANTRSRSDVRHTTPAPVAFASPIADHSSPRPERLLAIRELLSIGWLHGVYDNACQGALSGIAYSPDDRRRLADVDTPTSPNGARAQLLDTLRAGQLRGPARTHARQIVARSLNAWVLLGESNAQVLPHDEQDRAMDASAFFQPLLSPSTILDAGFWTDDAVLHNRHSQVDTQVEATPGVPGLENSPVPTSHTTPVRSERSSLVAQAVRYDMSQPVSRSDLRLFNPAGDPPSTPDADDGQFYGA